MVRFTHWVKLGKKWVKPIYPKILIYYCCKDNLMQFNVRWRFLVHKHGLQIQLTHLLNYFDVK